ncbi:MAG: FAD-dependent oxidoreductase, partial [Deltaproteobacteria bacterium]|nr:FAD-dependent oxidoreductase [Deltaproteobacteria bacterium]
MQCNPVPERDRWTFYEAIKIEFIMEIIIVGGGAAGYQAALHCRKCWPKKSVTLIEAEGEVGYCRPLLPQLMSGQVTEEKLFLWKPGEDSHLQVRTGVRVQSLDRESQSLVLENRERIKYERLILAAGGRPFVPRLAGAEGLKGIFPVRNLPDAKKAHDWLAKDQTIGVLGGGLVGVKTAVDLRVAGFRVSIVEREDHLLPQALAPKAARVVEAHFGRMGIGLFFGATVEHIEGERGAITAVKVSGQRLPCDSLLVATGATPNISFLEGSGLLENGKLLVSPALQTRDPRIFAAGDAVTIAFPDGKTLTPWTWPQAVSQGKLAAENLYRPSLLHLKTLTRVNSMNLSGLSLAMLGAAVEGAKEIGCARPDEGIFRQAFLQSGRLAGGALLGDISGAGP